MTKVYLDKGGVRIDSTMFTCPNGDQYPIHNIGGIILREHSPKAGETVVLAEGILIVIGSILAYQFFSRWDVDFVPFAVICFFLGIICFRCMPSEEIHLYLNASGRTIHTMTFKKGDTFVFEIRNAPNAAISNM